MHGLIHVIFRGFVVDKFGESAWKEILKIAGTLTEFLWWLEKRRLVHSVSLFFRGKVCSCQELFPTFPLGTCSGFVCFTGLETSEALKMNQRFLR